MKTIRVWFRSESIPFQATHDGLYKRTALTSHSGNSAPT